MGRKYKMVTLYDVLVNGRCFETTDNEERRNWLLGALPKHYIGATVTYETKRKRKYI